MSDDAQKVAVLYARTDSIYKSIQGVDVWDIERDARKWPGGCQVVAHPPCRAWGKLRHFAKPRHDEKELAIIAVSQVRQWGGVLEHPAGSTLWQVAKLPPAGEIDEFGGWTLPIVQSDFGHRAEKATFLYIVGVDKQAAGVMPLVLGKSSHVVETRIRKGCEGWRPSVTKGEREKTPYELALWLVNVARFACVPCPGSGSGSGGGGMSWAAEDFLDIVAHLRYQEILHLPDVEWFRCKARYMAAALIQEGCK